MTARRRALGLLASLSVLIYADRVCISVAGPRLQSELGLSPPQWGLVDDRESQRLGRNVPHPVPRAPPGPAPTA